MIETGDPYDRYRGLRRLYVALISYIEIKLASKENVDNTEVELRGQKEARGKELSQG